MYTVLSVLSCLFGQKYCILSTICQNLSGRPLWLIAPGYVSGVSRWKILPMLRREGAGEGECGRDGCGDVE